MKSSVQFTRNAVPDDVPLSAGAGLSPVPDAAASPADGHRHHELVAGINEVLRLARSLGMVHGLPPVLTVDQAAEVLNLDRKTVYFCIQRRELPGVRRFGKTVRISTEALMTWMFKGRGGDPSR